MARRGKQGSALLSGLAMIGAAIATPATGRARGGFDGAAPQEVQTSGKAVAALQRCMLDKLGRYGAPVFTRDLRRVVIDFKQASPPLTVVINDLAEETRSVEVWRAGPRDHQLWRDTLACR
ncbi:hypothetical protein U1839_01680 [Sphingomonas sp. RT2P30]